MPAHIERDAHPKSESGRLWRVLRPVLEHAMDCLALRVEKLCVGKVPCIERLEHLRDLGRRDQIQARHLCARRGGSTLQQLLQEVSTVSALCVSLPELDAEPQLGNLCSAGGSVRGLAPLLPITSAEHAVARILAARLAA